MSYANLKDPIGACKQFEYVAGGTVVAGTMSTVGDTLVYNLDNGESGDTIRAIFETGSNGLELPKQAALAIAAGANVFWDSGAGEVDTTGTNTPLGICIRAAAAGDAKVRVTLKNPTATA